jgi:hypothetical protein
MQAAGVGNCGGNPANTSPRAERAIIYSDVRASDLKTNCASAASTSPSGELCAGGDGGTTLFRSVSSDEDGGTTANIAASGASNQTQRCSRRRSAGGDGGTTLFRSVSSDEDGGTTANIAASGASNQTQRCASSLRKIGRSRRIRARDSARQRPRRRRAGSARRRRRTRPAAGETPQGCAIR